MSKISQLLPGHCCQAGCTAINHSRTCTSGSWSCLGQSKSFSCPKIRPTCFCLAQRSYPRVSPHATCVWVAKWDAEIVPGIPPSLSWMQLSWIHRVSFSKGSDYNSPWSWAHIKFYLWKYQAGRQPKRLLRLGSSRNFLLALPESQVPNSFFIPCIFPAPQPDFVYTRSRPAWCRCHGAEVCQGWYLTPVPVQR